MHSDTVTLYLCSGLILYCFTMCFLVQQPAKHCLDQSVVKEDIGMIHLHQKKKKRKCRDQRIDCNQ